MNKTISILLGSAMLFSISLWGQQPAGNSKAVTSAQISVQITKKNWDKIREYGTAAVDPLIVALKDSDSAGSRAEIAETLGTLGDKRAVEPLKECLLDRNPQARMQAAKALGKLKDKLATNSLIGCLNDNSKEVRLAVVEALKSLADEKAFPYLVKSLKDSDAVVRTETIKAMLITGGEKAGEPFLEHLKDPSGESKVEIIKALGVLGDKSAVDPLISLLKGKDKVLKMWSVISLGKIGDARAVEPLKECLNENDPVMKERVIETLKKLNVEIKPVEASKTAAVTKPVTTAQAGGKKPETKDVPVMNAVEATAEKQGSEPSVKSMGPTEKKKGAVHWWIVGIVGMFLVILIVLGTSGVLVRKTPEDLRKELDKLAMQAKEACAVKSGDPMINHGLSLLEAQSVAYMLFPTFEGTVDEKRKCLETMKETNAKISRILGSFHKGVRLLLKMNHLVEKNFDALSSSSRRPVSSFADDVKGKPEDSTELSQFPGVVFRKRMDNDNGTYEIYSADRKEDAFEFLRKTPVMEERKYLIVETPLGGFGKDFIAIFNEVNGAVIEYGVREPLPSPIRSRTHCVKCGYPVMPAGPALDAAMEKFMFEQLKSQDGESLLLDQLKKQGIGLFCNKCNTACCPFCLKPESPSICELCLSDMAIYRRQ